MNEDVEKKWWYSYDPFTFKYTGMRLANTQPDNTTTIAPADIVNPVWNSDNETWEGEDLNKKLTDLRQKYEANENAKEQPMATLAKMVADIKTTTDTSISALMLQIAELKSTLGETK